MAGNAARQLLLIAVSHLVSYGVKRSIPANEVHLWGSVKVTRVIHIYVTYVGFWKLNIACPNGGQWVLSAKIASPAQTSSYVTDRYVM